MTELADAALTLAPLILAGLYVAADDAIRALARHLRTRRTAR